MPEVFRDKIFARRLMVLAGRKQRYERYAVECLRLAQLAKRTEERNLLVQMAETWRQLADGEENVPKSNVE